MDKLLMILPAVLLTAGVTYLICEQKHSKLKAKSKENNTNIAKNNAKIKDLNSLNNQLEDKFKKEELENTRLREDIQSLTDKINELQFKENITNKEYETNLTLLNNEIKRLNDNIYVLNSTKTKIENDNSNLDNENKYLKEKIEELNVSIESLNKSVILENKTEKSDEIAEVIEEVCYTKDVEKNNVYFNNDTIYNFKLKPNDIVIEIKSEEELKDIENNIKDTTNIISLLEQCDNKDKEKYIKKINSYNKQLDKEFEKYKKKNNDIDEETTSDVIDIIMKTLDRYFIKQLMTGLYRALNNNKNDEFYTSFINELNKYLEKNNIYTYEVYPNTKIKDTDYTYYKITATSKESTKKIINEVERFAYVIRYVDEYEDETYSICQGEMYI